MSGQPELFISLSHDRVTLNLSETQGDDQRFWKDSFEINGLMFDDHISDSLDSKLYQNQALINNFSSVEILLLDRPHVSVPNHFSDHKHLLDIALRHLRPRMGDTLVADKSKNGTVCYTIPTKALSMFREYYANLSTTHLASVITEQMNSLIMEFDDSVTCYSLIQNTLIVLSFNERKLKFSKTFTLRNEADLVYYSTACNRMLHTENNLRLSIEGEEQAFKLHNDQLLNLTGTISVPPLHVMMEQYQQCVS